MRWFTVLCKSPMCRNGNTGSFEKMLNETCDRCSCWNSCTPDSVATMGWNGSTRCAKDARSAFSRIADAALGGHPNACFTGGRTAWRSRSSFGVSGVLLGRLGAPAPPTTPSNALTLSGDRGTSFTNPSGCVAALAAPNAFSIISTTPGTSAWKSPTTYSVAFAGKYQRSWNCLTFAASQVTTWSSLPIGKRHPKLLSQCRCCNSWQSTRYSMVFIICASAKTAFFSFATRVSSSCGLNATSYRMSNTLGIMYVLSLLCVGECTWNTVWWKSVYAFPRVPDPNHASRFFDPKNVTCSTRCAKPCSSSRSSTLPTCISRCASNRSPGTLLGNTTYLRPFERRPRWISACAGSSSSSKDSTTAGAITSASAVTTELHRPSDDREPGSLEPAEADGSGFAAPAERTCGCAARRLAALGTTRRPRRGATTAACLGGAPTRPAPRERDAPVLAIALVTVREDARLTTARARTPRGWATRGATSDVACGARHVIAHPRFPLFSRNTYDDASALALSWRARDRRDARGGRGRSVSLGNANALPT
mmetsp:Transcript_14061/g.46618  ORF Transcript_14061/g.46618 Transcript_14061/m.46618 type:complete len:537 (-) Transcript_14061:21-1631(-)